MFKFKNKKVTCDLLKILKMKNIKKLDLLHNANRFFGENWIIFCDLSKYNKL